MDFKDNKQGKDSVNAFEIRDSVFLFLMQLHDFSENPEYSYVNFFCKLFSSVRCELKKLCMFAQNYSEYYGRI